MKRLAKLMVVATFAISPFLIGASASAQAATCEIGFTGPDSNNVCTSTTSYSCSVTSANNVVIKNTTTQETTSGTVTINGNTTGGSGSSGTVTNSSGTTFTVTITNPNPQAEQPGVCTASVTVPATQPPAPVVPAGGGQVKALPATSGDTTLQTTGLIASIVVVLAGLGMGGVLWYRTHKA